MSDYKPTEHDGLKKDGTPDQRVKGNNDNAGSNTSSSDNSGSDNSGSGDTKAFAGGKVDPVEAGKKGGETSS